MYRVTLIEHATDPRNKKENLRHVYVVEAENEKDAVRVALKATQLTEQYILSAEVEKPETILLYTNSRITVGSCR